MGKFINADFDVILKIIKKQYNLLLKYCYENNTQGLLGNVVSLNGAERDRPRVEYPAV